MANNKTHLSMFKKIFFAAALMMSTVCFAQFSALNAPKADAKASWSHIGQPFVATTIDGQTIDLQAWIDSGYSVVIDYSCCWCGPCWRLHTAGILEGFHRRFGSEGTNQLRVLWIEVEGTNTIDQIYGTTTSNDYSGLTQGDWTLGGTFPIPIIDDASTLATCQSIYDNAVPFVVYIEGITGRCCSIYGEPDGISHFDTAICNAHMADMLALRPVPGGTPNIQINGPTNAVKGVPLTFSAVVSSYEPYSNVHWTIDGANISEADGETVTITFTSTGSKTLTVSATNPNGTNSATFVVNVTDYSFGPTMTYFSGQVENAIGTNNTVTWGVKFPDTLMVGRNFLKNVEIYSNYNDNIILTVYQGGEDAPQNQIYTRTSQVNQNMWNTINISGAVALDQHQPLWITFTSSQQYPVVFGPYNGDPNSCMIQLSGRWMNVIEASNGSYEGSWAIKATTADQGNAGISTLESIPVAVYPNPATDKVTVLADNISRVEVLDITGRVVATTTEHVVNIADLESGVYFFRIITAQGTYSQRVVKK